MSGRKVIAEIVHDLVPHEPRLVGEPPRLDHVSRLHQHRCRNPQEQHSVIRHVVLHGEQRHLLNAHRRVVPVRPQTTVAVVKRRVREHHTKLPVRQGSNMPPLATIKSLKIGKCSSDVARAVHLLDQCAVAARTTLRGLNDGLRLVERPPAAPQSRQTRVLENQATRALTTTTGRATANASRPADDAGPAPVVGTAVGRAAAATVASRNAPPRRPARLAGADDVCSATVTKYTDASCLYRYRLP